MRRVVGVGSEHQQARSHSVRPQPTAPADKFDIAITIQKLGAKVRCHVGLTPVEGFGGCKK